MSQGHLDSGPPLSAIQVSLALALCLGLLGVLGLRHRLSPGTSIETAPRALSQLLSRVRQDLGSVVLGSDSVAFDLSFPPSSFPSPEESRYRFDPSRGSLLESSRDIPSASKSPRWGFRIPGAETPQEVWLSFDSEASLVRREALGERPRSFPLPSGSQFGIRLRTDPELPPKPGSPSDSFREIRGLRKLWFEVELMVPSPDSGPARDLSTKIFPVAAIRNLQALTPSEGSPGLPAPRPGLEASSSEPPLAPLSDSPQAASEESLLEVELPIRSPADREAHLARQRAELLAIRARELEGMARALEKETHPKKLARAKAELQRGPTEAERLIQDFDYFSARAKGTSEAWLEALERDRGEMQEDLAKLRELAKAGPAQSALSSASGKSP